MMLEKQLQELSLWAARWQNGLAPAFGPGPDPRAQDRIRRQAPCMKPASPSGCVSASLSVCLS